MNTSPRFAPLALAVAALMVPTLAHATDVIKARQPIPGQYIVLYRGGATTVNPAGGPAGIDLSAQEDKISYRHRGRVDRAWNHAVKGFAVRMTATQARALAADPDVALVEEDGILTASAVQNGATWGLDRLDQRDLPLDSTYGYEAQGSGVTAYVIDSGINTAHTEFGGRASGGFSVISDGRGTADCYGHGTEMAGIIGGATYGVAKDVKLVSVRALDCKGSGPTSGVISAVDWVTRNRTLPAVANLSIAGNASTALDTAVQNSINAGVVYTVAAGNSGANACRVSPARVAAALTVGAIDSGDTRASFSNFGTCLDLFAPGVGIPSAWFSGNAAAGTVSGTSAASAHAAGAAALYLSARPGSTPAQVAAALTASATPGKVSNAGSGSPNRLIHTGAIVNPVLPADTTRPTVSLITPTDGAALTGTVTLKASASDNQALAKVEFFADGAALGTAANAPYQIAWNSASLVDGVHRFTAKAIDTAGNTGTSAPVTAATANGAVPAPACGNGTQLLANPGFETGKAAPWTAAPAILGNASSIQPHGGRWAAWLNGYGRSYTDTLYQQVTIPADACGARLGFWVRIITAETSKTLAKDVLTVTVRSTEGQVLETLGRYSNLSVSAGYVRKSFDLTAYRGQTIRLHFQGVEDASRATSFLLDDFALDVTQ